MNILEKAAAPLACVVLAAGQGTRMKSARPKVMHLIAGKTMIAHVLAACEALVPQKIVVVVAPGHEEVRKEVAPCLCAVQDPPLGTGHAARTALPMLEGFEGDVLILFGDTPLLTPRALQGLRARKEETGAALVVAGFEPTDCLGYGRLIVNGQGELESIVEAKDATPEQLAVRLCNGGIMLGEAAKLRVLLDRIDNKNAKGEYYLTDCVRLARTEGWRCAMAHCENDDVRGVNSRAELAEAEAAMQKRLREKAMAQGVTMTDPDSVFLCPDTVFGQDVTIGPNVVFGPGVKVGSGVEIRPFCHIEGAEIEDGAAIGPFARLRPGAKIGADAHIGNFVEIKKAVVEAGAKVNHLSYIGDARVGAKANVGAGTITCNYDGFTKAHTDIGAGAFIGSNTALVAPVKVGEGAIVGAGSVVTKEVPADALAVSRSRQETVSGWAARFRRGKEKK